MNSRTKETKYYQISGAKETSAMYSAQGQVQHLNYQATFPILLNIADEPTYFLSLKDNAGLVKKYAMVNIQKYQIVAIGDTVAECEKAYRELMAGNGIETTDTSRTEETAGTIQMLKAIVSDGNTYYYFTLEDGGALFEAEAKSHLDILRKETGDEIWVRYISSDKGIYTVVDLK